MVGIDIDVTHDALLDDRQAARADAFLVEQPRAEAARDQRVVDDRQRFAERLLANQVGPERPALLDATRRRGSHQAADQGRGRARVDDQVGLRRGPFLGPEPRKRSLQGLLGHVACRRQRSDMLPADVVAVRGAFFASVAQRDLRAIPAIGFLVLAGKAVAARVRGLERAVVHAGRRGNYPVVCCGRLIQRATPVEALLPAQVGHRLVHEIEVGGRTVREQGLRRNLPIIVRLEGPRYGNRLRDELPQAFRLEIRRRVARIATRCVDLHGQVPGGRVLDLLDLAIAILELHVAAARRGCPGVARAGRPGGLDGLLGAFLQISRHFRLPPSCWTRARSGCPAIPARAGRSCRRSSRRCRGARRSQPS